MPIGLEFCVGFQENIILRLVMRNLSCDAYLLFFILGPLFGKKMGVATTRAPNVLGPRNPTKKLAHWVELLGQPLSRNEVLEISMGEPPLKA